MSNRLSFERALISNTRKRTRTAPGIRLRWLAGLACLAVALAAGASAWFTSLTHNRASLIQTTTTFAALLGADDVEGALALCAEGELGAQLVAAEEARSFIPGAQSSATVSARSRAARLSCLRRMRDDLARDGLDWPNTQVIAFGGTSAQVLDQEIMREPAHSVVGNIYLVSDEQVFAIDVALRECLNTYVITEIWQWSKLSILPSEVKRHSAGEHKALKRESASADERPQIQNPKHLFVKL